MTVVGVVFAVPLLRFMGGKGISPEAFQYAVDYLKIQMYGFIPLCMTFTVTAVLRGIGDTRKPLFYNTISIPVHPKQSLHAMRITLEYFLHGKTKGLLSIPF